MVSRAAFFFFITAAVSAVPLLSQQRNVILFVGDGAGISSLNAASIVGYGKPQALYVQHLSHHLALADNLDRKRVGYRRRGMRNGMGHRT